MDDIKNEPESIRKGHIKLARQILDWGWYKESKTKDVFIHLLLKANWKGGTFKGSVIPPGSLVTSVPVLSEELGFSIQEVRTCLKHLINTGEINRQITNKYSIITITKWGLFQSPNSQPTDSRQTVNSLSTGNQHSMNSQLTTIEERKKGRKEDKEEEEEGYILVSKDTNCQKQVSNDFRTCIEEWNKLEPYGIKPVQRITVNSKRGKMLNARIKDYGVDDVIKAIGKVRDSDFLQGKTSASVVWFNFEWFVKPNNFPKVLEGNYDNSEKGEKGKTDMPEWKRQWMEEWDKRQNDIEENENIKTNPLS